MGMEQKQANVFVVDDYAPMRQSLRKLFELEQDFQLCGEAADVDGGYEGIVAHKPDVVIVDLILGQQSGIELLKRMDGMLKKVPVLILSMLPEALNAETVLALGARGYIMKTESPDQILTAIRQVLNGDVYLSPAMALKLQTKRRNTHE